MWPFKFAMHRRRGLRVMVVSLLSASPKNGVEIMDAVEAMTRGWWRPTPGAIYPLLNKMSEEGTVKKRQDGRYELTSTARKELEVTFGHRFREPRTVDEVSSVMHGFVSYLEDLDSTGKRELEPHIDKLKALGRRLLNLGTDKEDVKGKAD